MKKIIDCIGRCILIIAISIGWIFEPLNVEAAIKKGDTLNSLKKDLAALEQKKKDAQNKTQSEIEDLRKQADRTVAEIDEVKEESKNLLVLYQKLESENIYMEYITGASSMTELIMRSDMIGQLTNYNEQKLQELELLTENNKKLNKQLDKYEVTLNSIKKH